MHTRVLIYCRLSKTDEGADALSLVSQESALRERAAREGWRVVGVEVDADLKGWMDETERPGLDAVLRRAEAREYDLLLVWDMSRLARRIEYQERWIRLLSLSGVEVESHTEAASRTTPLVRHVLGAVAEHRTREISAASRRSLRKRAERGLSHGIVPWGYRRVGKDQPLALVEDERIVEAIRTMFAMRADGVPPTRIAAWLEQEGLRTPRGHARWNYRTIVTMCANPVYRGAANHASGIVEDAHEAIVDPELWERAQLAYRTAGRQRAAHRHSPETWLNGVVLHSCGRPMYPVRAPEHGEGRARLRCRAFAAGVEFAGSAACDQPRRSTWVEQAEREVWAAVADAVAHVLPLASVIREQKRRYRDTAPAAGARRRELEERRRRIAERQDRAERLYLDGVRDRAWFDVEDARISAELAAVDAALDELPKPPDEIALAQMHAQLKELRPLLDAIPDSRRGEVLRQLGVAVLGDDGWRIRFHPEWEGLFRPDS